MIIGLCGQAGSGKDTVADFLVRDHGFVKVALADPIKRAAKDWFAFTDRQLWGPSELRNQPDLRYFISEGYAKAYEEHKNTTPEVAAGYARSGWLTPRQALQIMGTEVGRRCYPDIWVEYAMRTANQLLRKDYSRGERVFRYTPQTGLCYDETLTYVGIPEVDRLPLGVVISDVRFRNEVLAIRAAGGYVWRLERSGAGLMGEAGAHQSETEQNEIDPALFSTFLFNHGTLEDLERLTGDKVHEAFQLQQEQLRLIGKK